MNKNGGFFLSAVLMVIVIVHGLKLQRLRERVELVEKAAGVARVEPGW